MELKWLEDFVSLARTGNFSRSAGERHITQSAFSRRIQALETWLGVALIDRSTYPTSLTPAGREFRETAEEAVRMLHGTQHIVQVIQDMAGKIHEYTAAGDLRAHPPGKLLLRGYL